MPKLRSASLATFLIAASAFELIACEDAGLTVVKPKMVLSPDPTTFDFGEVVLGPTEPEAEPKIIKVSNTGEGRLSLDSVAPTGDDAAAFYVSSFPTALAPSQSGEIWVRYRPTQPKPSTSTLVITSNDPTRPSVSYPLKGTARERCGMISDSQRESFVVGQTKTITVKAVSSHDCTIDRVFSDPRVFPIKNMPQLPFVIPAGKSFGFEVEHKPIVSSIGGVPVRDMVVRETEGGEIDVILEGEAPLFGCFSIYPSELVFSQTELGQTRRQRVTLSNSCGKAAAIVSAVVGEGYDNYAIDMQTYPLSVPPGGTTEIWVTYSPASDIGDHGRLIINTNDAANPRFNVSLSGTAALPSIEVFPSQLDFGSVIVRGMGTHSDCSSAVRIVNAYNTGAAPLTISQLEFPAAGDRFYQVVGVTVDGTPVIDFTQPFQVPTGKSAQIAVQFYPTHVMPAEHHASFTIHHNAPEMTSDVSLTGRGIVDGSATDVFEQPTGPKVDILWVVDNSCSMYDKQARLTQNLSQFVSYADSQHADYQMGVTTTDGHSPEAGKLVQCFPHPRVINSTYADRQAAFDCMFLVGTNGPSVERGLGAGMLALQRAQDPDQDPIHNPNAGFLRPDATLAVVVMSDEEDQSDESLTLLRDYYLSVKPGRTHVHAIAGPVSEVCITRNAEPGFRYHQMTVDTGGLFFNICQPDWSPVLHQLGLNTFVALTEWALSQAADPSTVHVSVDGTMVPYDPANGFTFSTRTNSVTFHGGAVPGPGQQITVNYAGNCRP